MSVRRLYRDGALADARSDALRVGVSILVEDGRIAGDPLSEPRSLWRVWRVDWAG